MKPVIKRITIITGAGVKQFEIDNNPFGIAKIMDFSLKYESSRCGLYEIFDEKDNLLVRIENCPVVIEFESKQLTEQEIEDLPF